MGIIDIIAQVPLIGIHVDEFHAIEIVAFDGIDEISQLLVDADEMLVLKIDFADDIHICLLCRVALEIEQRRILKEDIGIGCLYRSPIIECDDSRLIMFKHGSQISFFLCK